MKGRLFSSTLLILAVIGYVASSYWPRGSPHELGQQLLLAAEQRHWLWAEVLLDFGADPNVTELAPEQLAPHGFQAWLGVSVIRSHPMGYLTREAALEQAMEQGNGWAVRLLLDHHAAFTPQDIYKCQFSGSRAVINLMEDAGKVPLSRRNVAQMPFANGGETSRCEVIPGTIGTVPTRHILWLSPRELLLVHDNPPRFAALNLDTGGETDLPGLSKKWADQEQFDPDMLALSPDGQWLLGFGGTSDHPTWLATQVRGNGSQEWDRNAQPDPAFKVATHGEGKPLIAWRDNSRWVEIPVCPAARSVVRLRTLGQADVQELPLDRTRYSFVLGYPFVLFTFTQPDRGLIRGVVGGTGNNSHFVSLVAAVIPGSDSWHMENGGEIRLEQAKFPGWFERCVSSPDGRRLAWINLFSNSEVRDILLSDADGKNFRIVHEFINPVQEWKARRAEAPWLRSLEWTPQGDGLVFWRGEKGENGLGLLRVSPGE